MDWFPYFGNQKRFTRFALEAIDWIREVDEKVPEQITFGETNAGSCAVALAMACAGHNVFTNDISAYSYDIARGLAGLPPLQYVGTDGAREVFLQYVGTDARPVWEHIFDEFRPAVVGACIVNVFGYDIDVRPGELDNPKPMAQYYHDMLRRGAEAFKGDLRYGPMPQRPGSITPRKGDLMDFLRVSTGDAVYMDFAWPWRSGEGTNEYTVMVDLLSEWLSGVPHTMDTWTIVDVMDNVLAAIDAARWQYRYVILSNQSSNYPTPEVLEPVLAEKYGHDLLVSRRLTLPAEDVDNRGLEPTFTEYQYIVRGY